MEAKELFKSKMKARKVNMVWLSKQTGISNATLSRFFSGKTDLPLAKFVKICEELNIKIFPDEN